jgi:hypothetical protein
MRAKIPKLLASVNHFVDSGKEIGRHYRNPRSTRVSEAVFACFDYCLYFEHVIE